MPSTNYQRQCDARRLRDYLERRLSAAQEITLESHLEQCASCRQQISDWVALLTQTFVEEIAVIPKSVPNLDTSYEQGNTSGDCILLSKYQ